MREIKFRYWDKQFKQFETFAPPCILNDGVHEFSEINDGGMYFDIAPTKRYIIMQFTGLKDRNDKDIYEGDIVIQPKDIGIDDEHENIGEVRYVDDSYVVVTKDYDDGKIFVIDFYEYTKPEEFEIIGNIYENPELLKLREGK